MLKNKKNQFIIFDHAKSLDAKNEHRKLIRKDASNKKSTTNSLANLEMIFLQLKYRRSVYATFQLWNSILYAFVIKPQLKFY